MNVCSGVVDCVAQAASQDQPWSLGTGSGTRAVVISVQFPAGTFANPPQVTLGITSINTVTQAETNGLAVYGNAQAIDNQEFNLQVSTADNVIISALSYQWIAIGD